MGKFEMTTIVCGPFRGSEQTSPLRCSTSRPILNPTKKQVSEELLGLTVLAYCQTPNVLLCYHVPNP